MSLAWPLVALVAVVLGFLLGREWLSGHRRSLASRLTSVELESRHARAVAEGAASTSGESLSKCSELASRVSKLETRGAMTRAG
jgi:hypothetical protein